MISPLPKPPPIILNSKRRPRARGKALTPKGTVEAQEEVKARMIRRVKVKEAMIRRAAKALEALARELAITAAVTSLLIARENGARVRVVAEFAANLGTITLILDSVPEKGLTSQKREKLRSQPLNPRKQGREVAEAVRRKKTTTLWGRRIPTLTTF
jgi:hypothetical protein